MKKVEKIVNALMLRAVDYGENDKILTLLTAEDGRIGAGIKGVKKAGAKLKFAAQPFCFAEYTLACKGDRYTVINASECESFYEIRTDLNKYYAACAVCEVALALTLEGDSAGDMLADCVRALGEMCRGDESCALISFLLAALRHAGYGLRLDGCSVCGRDLCAESRVKFNMDTGSFSCLACGEGALAGGPTFNCLRMAGKLPYKEELVNDDGKLRALRLLREYLCRKIDGEGSVVECLSAYMRLAAAAAKRI